MQSLILPILIILVLGMCFNFLSLNAIAVSPDYTRQVIVDDPDPTIDDLDNNPDLKATLKSGLLPMDIKSATFASDGRILTGTIWLVDPLYSENHFAYHQNNFEFTVFIDLPKETETVTEPAYSLTISPEQDGTWTKTLIEEEPELSYDTFPSSEISRRIIDTTSNYTGFFKDGERYVNFTIDLEKISYPNKYFVAVLTRAVNSTNAMELLDWTFSYSAPPVKNKVIYDWEKPIEIRAGTEKEMKLFINSTELNAKETQTLTDSNSSDGINISFSPNPVMVERTGVNFTNLLIKVAENLYTGMPTKINQNIKIDGITEAGVTISDSRTIIIDVLPPFSLAEILVQTNLAYIIPIGATAVIALWISKKIDRIKNYQTLTVETLLTVDASVIAGVLIFLTIGSAGVFSGVIQKVGILTASIVFPFAIAAIRTLMMGKVEGYGVKFTATGFIYLMTSVIVIGFVNS